MWTIRPEIAGDERGVEELVALCFGAGRFAKTAYRLREGVLPDRRLSFVAQGTADKALLGSVRFWPILVGQERSLLLGPLSVNPTLRGRGIGVGLMQHGIARARELGYRTILLVGDEPYYSRVGFARLSPGQVRFPGPLNAERLLGLSLVSGALETLRGQACRAPLDLAVSAPGAKLGG